MGNKILHKKSDVSGNTPALNVLSAGEIAINTADGFLFYKKIQNLVIMFQSLLILKGKHMF